MIQNLHIICTYFCVFLYRNQTIELNNSDSGDSPSTICTDKSNKTKVCRTLLRKILIVINCVLLLGYGRTLQSFNT